MGSFPLTEQDSVEVKVLALVAKKPVRTSALMDAARDHDISPAEVREADWRLLDDGKLGLSTDRHLTIR